MLDKNLLLGVDYAKGESKSVINFLKVICPNCKHKIEYTLSLWDIENVEAYIEELRQENRALKKGLNSLTQAKKKWKNRYYKLKEEVQSR